MNIRVNTIILIFLCSPIISFSANNINNCTITGKNARCDFSSLKSSPDNTVFFYCRTKKANRVEMYSTDVLTRGFSGSIKNGVGELFLRGENEIKSLNIHFFRVLLNPLSQNNPHITIYSDQDISCKIGKGILRTEMPGNLD